MFLKSGHIRYGKFTGNFRGNLECGVAQPSLFLSIFLSLDENKVIISYWLNEYRLQWQNHLIGVLCLQHLFAWWKLLPIESIIAGFLRKFISQQLCNWTWNKNSEGKPNKIMSSSDSTSRAKFNLSLTLHCPRIWLIKCPLYNNDHFVNLHLLYLSFKT